jgi:hypothetical protein
MQKAAPAQSERGSTAAWPDHPGPEQDSLDQELQQRALVIVIAPPVR